MGSKYTSALPFGNTGNTKRFNNFFEYSILISEAATGGVLRNFAPVPDRPATFLKKRLWHRCFPVNFAKFPRTSS